MLSEAVVRDLEKKHKIYQLDMFDNSIHELIEAFLEAGRWDLATAWISNRVNMYMCGSSIGIQDEERAVKRDKMMKDWEDQNKRCRELMEAKMGVSNEI